MKKQSVTFWITFFIIAFSYSNTLGQMWNYSPLTKSERGKTFQMKHIKHDSDGVPISLKLQAGLSGIYFGLERQDQSLKIHSATGKGRSDQNWRVELEFTDCGLPTDFYVGDLDGNGISDMVLPVPTCGNGLAPTVHLFTLLFDENGMPVPFEAEGYFEPLPNGIDALVDMDNDGRAELIYMNFNAGYWITNIYKCNKARWSRINGQFAKKKYPLFTRFTHKPNHKAVVPKADRHPFAPDLSNDNYVSEGKLISFIEEKWIGIELNIIDSKGSNIKCTPAYWFGSARIIFDKHNGRQISYLSHDNVNISLILNEIITKKLKVSLYGNRYSDQCSPEILWVKEDK